ncbi:MAG TPA: cupin domain-containing protein [Anaerolineae bacterium]|nr:cupin domain-containing protein [Anaerolineae bacterium]
MFAKNYREIPTQPVSDHPGVLVRWVISTPEGAPNFAMRIFDVEPGASTPLHAHHWEHEVFVLDGEGIVHGGGEERLLSPGTVVFVPPGETHQFRNTGSDVLRFICVIPTVPEALP